MRSDSPYKLSEAGWAAVREYGIRTVLDLRSDPECAEDPPLDPDLTLTRLSLFDHFDGDAEHRARLVARLDGLPASEQYRLLYLDALECDAPRFALALAVVAGAAPGAVLVHCAGGKDRTGLLCALLLRLAGVPADVIEADYARSEERLGVADSASRDVMDHVLEALEARHGSVAEYFAGAGASAADLERVAARLVGGAA